MCWWLTPVRQWQIASCTESHMSASQEWLLKLTKSASSNTLTTCPYYNTWMLLLMFGEFVGSRKVTTTHRVVTLQGQLNCTATSTDCIIMCPTVSVDWEILVRSLHTVSVNISFKKSLPSDSCYQGGGLPPLPIIWTFSPNTRKSDWFGAQGKSQASLKWKKGIQHSELRHLCLEDWI